MKHKTVSLLAASLTFNESSYIVTESSGVLQPVLILSNPSSTTFTVQVYSYTNDSAVGECINYQITLFHDSALGDDDYNSGPYVVTFPAGATNASFNVTIFDNNHLENNEIIYFTINSSSLPDNIVSDPSEVTMTILDDDCK